MPEPEREEERETPRQQNNQEKSGQNPQGRRERETRGEERREGGLSDAEREAQARERAAEETIERVRRRRREDAIQTIQRLGEKQDRSSAEEEELSRAFEIYNQTAPRDASTGPGSPNVGANAEVIRNMLNTPLGTRMILEQYPNNPELRRTIETDNELKALLQQRLNEIEGVGAGGRPLVDPMNAGDVGASSRAYVLYKRMMDEGWTPEKQRRYIYDRFRELGRRSSAIDSPESSTAYQLLTYSSPVIKETKLKDQFEALDKMYKHFATMINSTDFDPIMQSVNSIKAETLIDFMHIPFVADGVRLWEKHSGYDQDPDKAPYDKHGKDPKNRLTSILYLDGRAVEFRKLDMISELTTTVLAKRLEEHALKLKQEELKQGFLAQGKSEQDANREARERIRSDHALREQIKRNAQAQVAELKQEMVQIDRISDEQPVGNFEEDEEERNRRIENRKNWTIEFINQHPELYEEWKATTKEREMLTNDDPSILSVEKMAEEVISDAEFGVTFGQVGSRVLEREAYLDAMNPTAKTIDGKGENPMRRLFGIQKYALELYKDGKLKHVDPDIIENFINPVEDFLSNRSSGWWKKQPPEVVAWYYRMLQTPGKLDKYGRFLDMSECPFEQIDFNAENDAFNRGVMQSHYSNFLEPAEGVRKLLIKSGGFLENGTLKNFMEVAQAMRNLRWGEVPPREHDIEEAKHHRREAERKARKEGGLPQYTNKEPMPTREEATTKALRGMVRSWRRANLYTKEAIATAIYEAANEIDDPVITPKQADHLLRELYAPWGAFYPLAIELRKLRIGPAIWDVLLEAFKQIGKTK